LRLIELRERIGIIEPLEENLAMEDGWFSRTQAFEDFQIIVSRDDANNSFSQ